MIHVRDMTGRLWEIGAAWVCFDGRAMTASAESADVRFAGLYSNRISIDTAPPALGLPEWAATVEVQQTCPHGRETRERHCGACPGMFSGAAYRRILEWARAMAAESEVREACPMPVYFDGDTVGDIATAGFESAYSGDPETMAFAIPAHASAWEYGIARALACREAEEKLRAGNGET